MIEWVEFQNFKALRNATLPLSQFTLIVGPNGSGKSTALNALLALRQPAHRNFNQTLTVGRPDAETVALVAKWGEKQNDYLVKVEWKRTGHSTPALQRTAENRLGKPEQIHKALTGTRIFSLEANAIAKPVVLKPQLELQPSGENLAGVLDLLRDQNPERFEALNQVVSRLIPEYDRILFATQGAGQRSFALRTVEGRHPISAQNLSQGTLMALALLTIAYLPAPPSIVCLEEPDHGLHPRLLRDVRDALYRLAYPEGAHEKREPVQVIATTHNPYFLDLFREHPEQIVIAEKVGLEAKFSRLSDRADLEEILGDAPLSEVWYSGVLGGVPAGT